MWPAGVLSAWLSERAEFGGTRSLDGSPTSSSVSSSSDAACSAITRNRGTALLLVAVGFTWFLANFRPDALFVHRGLIVQLLVAYPGWRPRSPLDLGAVIVGYVVAFVLPVWRSEPISIVLGCALVGSLLAV